MAAMVDIQPLYTETRMTIQSNYRPAYFPPEQKTFPNELQRLQTFAKYLRPTSIYLSLLATQGFVYIGKDSSSDDYVTILCVFCNSKITTDMSEIHSIEKAHLSSDPNCPIVKKLKYKDLISEIHETLQISDSSSHNTIKGLTDQSKVYSERPSDSYHQEAGADSQSVIATHQTTNYSITQKSCSQRQADDTLTNIYLGQGLCQTETPNITSDGGLLSRQCPILLSKISSKREDRNDGESSSVDDERGSHSSALQHNNADTSNSNSGSSDNNSTFAEIPVMLNDHSSSDPPRSFEAQSPEEATSRNDAHSYETLGICTEQPKRQEYAVEAARLQSFTDWPSEHCIKPHELARAGFFYTGFTDCARCFFCGGGVRNWEIGDDVWVEHARWFSKCSFIRHAVGQPFIDVVQDMSEEREIILYEDVIREMRTRGHVKDIPKGIKDDTVSEVRKDPAVKVLIDDGFNEESVLNAASTVKEMGQSLATELIYEELLKQNVKRSKNRRHIANYSDINSKSLSKAEMQDKQNKETIESLRNKNAELRQMSLCKICMDKEVAVVFLPCGHFVSCLECSFALANCAICRTNIKGTVRAILS